MLSGKWHNYLEPEFARDYMLSLRSFLQKEKAQRKNVLPHSKNWFKAFELTPFENTKVVIVGQDPYYGPNQAHGLCFSVPEGEVVPPSLKNIFREIKQDLNIENSKHGNLKNWANQGVLLLNSVLTVEQSSPASHAGMGWERFTDAAIGKINDYANNVVFLLWGSYAQNKGRLIDRGKHLVLESSHPSPLSAHRGFLGCRHFSKTNSYLKKHNLSPINWQV